MLALPRTSTCPDMTAPASGLLMVAAATRQPLPAGGTGVTVGTGVALPDGVGEACPGSKMLTAGVAVGTAVNNTSAGVGVLKRSAASPGEMACDNNITSPKPDTAISSSDNASARASAARSRCNPYWLWRTACPARQ